MGLLTDIQPPDVETRLAILRKKAEDEVSPVPDAVLAFIAENINDNNIRALEGDLTRLTAWASLNREELTTDKATEILADLVAEREARPITPETILGTTAEYFGYTSVAWFSIALTGAAVALGLRHLRAVGASEVDLYVEADNDRALALYHRYGFSLVSADVMYAAPAAPAETSG